MEILAVVCCLCKHSGKEIKQLWEGPGFWGTTVLCACPKTVSFWQDAVGSESLWWASINFLTNLYLWTHSEKWLVSPGVLWIFLPLPLCWAFTWTWVFLLQFPEHPEPSRAYKWFFRLEPGLSAQCRIWPSQRGSWWWFSITAGT